MAGHGSPIDHTGDPHDTEAAIHDCVVAVSATALTWQDFLVRLAFRLRALAVRRPELALIAAAPGADAPWVRPPLSSARSVDGFLGALVGFGFGDEAAVAAYRSYTTFLLGQLLMVAADRGDGAGSTETGEPAPELADYPQLSRLRPLLSHDHGRAEFDEALESLIDRLESGIGDLPGRVR